MAYKALTIGDEHLDKKRINDVIGENAYQLQLAAVDQVFDYGREKGITHVVWLGDICDTGSLSDHSELALLQKVKQYDDEGFQQDFILGNHDKEQKYVHSLCKLAWAAESGGFKNVRVFTEYHSEVREGVTIEYLPFPETKARKKNSICYGHFERPGALRDNGTKIEHGIAEEKGSSWYVLGHLHTCQTMGRSIFPGTLFQTSFGETRDKFFCVLKAEMVGKKLEVQHKFIPSDKPFEFINLEITSVKDLKLISTNLMHKYRILYSADIDMPKNFLLRNPNVIEALPYRNKAELVELSNPDTVEFTAMDGLHDYLAKTAGLSKREVRKGVRIISKKLNILHGVTEVNKDE